MAANAFYWSPALKWPFGFFVVDVLFKEKAEINRKRSLDNELMRFFLYFLKDFWTFESLKNLQAFASGPTGPWNRLENVDEKKEGKQKPIYDNLLTFNEHLKPSGRPYTLHCSTATLTFVPGIKVTASFAQPVDGKLAGISAKALWPFTPSSG